MKTITSALLAKVAGFVINSVLALAGIYAIVYAVQFFGPKLF